MDIYTACNQIQKDMEFLRELLCKLQNENEKLQNENQQLKMRFERVLLQQSLIALLQKGNSGLNVEVLCKRLKIKDRNSEFLLLELFNDDILSRTSFLPSDNPFSDPEMRNLLASIQSAIGRIGTSISAPYGDRLLCLLEVPTEMDDVTLRRELTHQVQEMNRSIGSFKLYVSVGMRIKGVRLLPESFSTVKRLTDYKMVMGKYAPDILFADEIPSEQWSSDENLVPQEQRQFIFEIRLGAFAHAKESAQALLQRKLMNGYGTSALSLTMAALKDTYIHALGSACTDLKMFDMYIKISVVQRIAGAQTVQELETAINEVLDELDTVFCQDKLSDTLPQRIRSYIDENYQNTDINVNAVADFFHISTSYATRIFRRTYGRSILDYIHQRRLFTAKELLGSGQSIAEISRQSGYGSSSNMIRAFKRAEGKTPGQLIQEYERRE